MGVVHRDVLRRDAGGAVYRWPHARRRPWRRAIAIVGYVLYGLLCLTTAALALIGALHLYYITRPLPEPVSWSCPAEWVVMPGDTLWDIARTCWPEAHTGAMVAEIRRLNPDVDPGRLRVGQVLQLPAVTEIAGGAE